MFVSVFFGFFRYGFVGGRVFSFVSGGIEDEL